MDDLIKVWLKPEYLPMLAAVTLAVKYLVVPVLKEFWPSTAYNGSTSVKMALAGGALMAFLWRVVFGTAMGPWTPASIVTTAIVGLLAGASAIGLNVVAQTARGKNVSISKE